MKSTTGIRAIVVGLLALVGVAGAVATADATTPGANGKIAFRRYFDQDHSSGALFTANPDGSDVQQITHPAAGPVLDNEPDWSPDGKQVVFQRNDGNGCGTNCETAEIWVVNADGSNAMAIVKDPVGKGCALDGKPAGGSCRGGPAWSPDGKRIIFECGAPNGPGGFCVANADGSNEVHSTTRRPTAPTLGRSSPPMGAGLLSSGTS